MRAICTESLVHENLFNPVVYGSNETHIIMHNLKTWNWNQLKFGNKLFWFVSSDSCHIKILRKSLNILLIDFLCIICYNDHFTRRNQEKIHWCHGFLCIKTLFNFKNSIGKYSFTDTWCTGYPMTTKWAWTRPYSSVWYVICIFNIYCLWISAPENNAKVLISHVKRQMKTNTNYNVQNAKKKKNIHQLEK